MQIEYFIKSVYGNDLIYIKDESQANTIRRITGKKTIDEQDITQFEKLGLTFTQVLPN